MSEMTRVADTSMEGVSSSLILVKLFIVMVIFGGVNAGW
jgi:hypothetical protein